MNADIGTLIDELKAGKDRWYHSKLNQGNEELHIPNANFVGRLSSVADLRFHRPVRFTECTFPDGFTFEGAEFSSSSKLTLEKCIFEGNTTFKNAKFAKGLHILAETRFCGAADFQSVLIRGRFEASGAIFKGVASFREVQGETALWTFEVCHFASDCTFFGEVGALDFRGSKFHKSLIATKLKVRKTFALRGVKIRESLSLMDVECATLFIPEAWIRKDTNASNIVVNGMLHANLAKFGRLAIFAADGDKSIPLPSVDFTGARVLQKIDFRNRKFAGAAGFRNVYFALAPSFHNCQLHQDTDFEGAKFPDTKSYDAERCYRTLKLAMNAHQAHREELDFFAKELKAKAAKETRKSVSLLYWLYEHVSDYGRSIKLPAQWLGGLVALSALIYAATIELPRTLKCAFQPECSLYWDWDRASAMVSLALYQSLPFIALLKDSATQATKVLLTEGETIPLAAQAWSIAQGFGSVALLFLIALALRNLFRLK